MKIFYNEEGWVCERYPQDIPVTDTNRFVEVDENIGAKTYSSQIGQAWRVVNGELQEQIYNVDDYNLAYNEAEIQALKTWFNEYYTIQEQKFRRLHTLGKLTDEGQDPYQALLNLYNLAEINRARIQELEALIG